ncbi:MAG: MBL fold metallo-hydrolase [Pseudomonadota bacterium]
MNNKPPMPSRFHLQFLGANATVTGSRHLITAGDSRVLVDCGLFQGYKPLRLRNWAEFPVDPASIDAVVLTHAHLDHSGYLPRLVKSGFRGRAWCTEASRSLCGILLPDSGRLLEEEAAYANRSGSSKHHPAEPLYSEADARASLTRLKGVGFDHVFEPASGIKARFRMQGHILGAAAVTLEFEGTRVTFSGDLGRPDDPLMLAPAPLAESDWVVVESTYGNRVHPAETLEQELLAVLKRVLARKGVVVIPAFAVGRAQMLLHVITQLQSSGHLQEAPLYLNSPMAASVADLYRQYPRLHRLDDAALAAMERSVHVIDSVEASKALNRRKGPMIIVSASGMATGGRVLHHLVAFAPDPRNAIVLCGFQAGGTRGASLAAGDRQLRIFGRDIHVGAEVVQLAAGSAHADANEILGWLKTAPTPPRKVFVTHGELDAADALRARIEHELGWPAHFPEYLEQVDLA